MRKPSLAIAASILLAPGLLLAPVWRMGGLGAGEDDILYYYPSRVFFAESISAGQLPLINPWTGLGRPFAADPQSALWYPFTWLFAAIPPQWAYGGVLWLHYSLAIWGMYRLLRSFRVNRAAAIFGGIAFAFSGFMLAHRVHFTIQNAAAWTPWVLWRLACYAEKGSAPRLLFASLAAAMQCLAGHTQIAAITAIGSLVFILGLRGLTLRAIARWLLTWLATAGLYAIQWMPTLAYIQVCTRTKNNYWDFTQNSWSPLSVVNWLLPMLFGQRTPNLFNQPYWGPSHQCEQFAYAGILPLLLAAIVIRRGCRSDPRRWALLLIGAFALLLALGKMGPLCPILYWLPGSQVFRAPARALFLFNLAIAGLAAFAVHDLTSQHSPARARLRSSAQALTRRPLITAIAAILLPTLLTLTGAFFCDPVTRTAAWTTISTLPIWSVAIPLAVTIASLYTLRLLARGWQKLGPVWPAFLVLFLDLAIVGWHIDVPAGHPTFDELVNPPDREEWLKYVRGSPHRFWCVTDGHGIYTDPLGKGAANTNSLVHVASLTDYGPLQPDSLKEFFSFAPWGASEKTEQLLTDTAWMGPFNVGWVLLCESRWPPPASCELVTITSDGKRLFRYAQQLSDAFIEWDGGFEPVRIESPSPCKVTVQIPETAARAHPGARVLLSRLMLPGWKAFPDGFESQVETAHGSLMAVQIPVSDNEVTWRFETPWLKAGIAVTLSTLALLTAFGYAALRAKPVATTRALSVE